MQLSFDVNDCVVVVLRGIPGSGKSTWASRCEDCPSVSRDEIRQRADEGYELDERARGDTWDELELERSRARRVLEDRDCVIIDDTHLKQRDLDYWADFAEEQGCRAVLVDFDVDVETAVQRNAEREKDVPEGAIRAMAGTKEGQLDRFDKVVTLEGGLDEAE